MILDSLSQPVTVNPYECKWLTNLTMIPISARWLMFDFIILWRRGPSSGFRLPHQECTSLCGDRTDTICIFGAHYLLP